MKLVRTAASAAALLLAIPAFADEPAPVVTRHQIRVNGQTLAYTAEAGRIAIRDVATGEPHAWMFYVAYRAPGADKTRKRPITFLWGGGPGGYSAYLDYEWGGPKRADGPRIADGDKLIDNDQTWLTDTDLVFVDAVGTGYSRAAGRDHVDEFMGTVGDTNSFVEFIRCWRIQHDAEDIPFYVGGQSWGAPRAATVAYALVEQNLPIAGAILVTGETSLNNRYVSPLLFEALRVVGMSNVALFHKKLAPDLGSDRAAISQAADQWVRATYVPALQRIESLSESERTQIVEGLARFTGIKPALIDRRTLTITPIQFRAWLFKDEDKTLNGSDVRLFESIPSNYMPAVLRRMKYELNYRTDLPYTSLSDKEEPGYLPLGAKPQDWSKWNWATSPIPRAAYDSILARWQARGGGPVPFGTPLPATEEAITRKPDLRFLIVIGRYDGESTCAANEEVMHNLPPLLQQAITLRCYESGHSPVRTPGVLAQFSGDVKELIRRTR